MIALALFLMMTPTPFATISLYDGSWQVTPAHAPGEPDKVDALVNHCTAGIAFYACEQVVNGKSSALIVFTATEEPGKFHTQAVLPNGRANGRADLTIDGDHWTYSSSATDDGGKTTWYRTENFFTGTGKIHYEQYESTDNKSWTKKSEGNEVRTAPK